MNVSQLGGWLSHRKPISRGGLILGLAALVGIMFDLGTLQGTPVAAQNSSQQIYTDVYNGWKWWHVYCYRCHGTDAVAATTAPVLIDPNGRLTEREFLKIVRDGRPDNGMQAWNKLLDDKQIKQIHMYVLARTDKVLPAGRPDEVGPNHGPWVPPAGWPTQK
jgi:mono/diheme cytochrome c family protein